MMKIQKRKVPSDSMLQSFLPVDYTDSFCCISDKKINSTPEDIMVRFWTDMPGWVYALFTFRNLLVKIVGLQGSSNDDSALQLENCIRKGGVYRFIEIVARNQNEIILVMRDKHLDAYISVQIKGKRCVYASTLVKYNNTLGKVYFFFIRPFHNLVVYFTLKRTMQRTK